MLVSVRHLLSSRGGPATLDRLSGGLIMVGITVPVGTTGDDTALDGVVREPVGRAWLRPRFLPLFCGMSCLVQDVSMRLPVYTG